MPAKPIVYIYANCDTCRKAKKWLAAAGIDAEYRPVREQPPTATELRHMHRAYEQDLRRLFNTSSKDYREAGIKDRIADLAIDDAIELLQANGNLVKRPFLIQGKRGLVGFKEADWAAFFS